MKLWYYVGVVVLLVKKPIVIVIVREISHSCIVNFTHRSQVSILVCVLGWMGVISYTFIHVVYIRGMHTTHLNTHLTVWGYGGEGYSTRLYVFVYMCDGHGVHTSIHISNSV